MENAKIKTATHAMPIRDTIAKPQNTVFILLVAVGVLYSDTIFSYYQLWMESGNPAYSHGSLAFVIALYIFLRYWLRTETLPPLKIHFAGFVLLLLSSLAWFVADAGNIQVLQQLALWALIGALFWCLFGFEMVKVLLIPLAVVLTAIPIWDFLNIHLQHITAWGVSFLLGFTGIPFVKEGVHILLQSGTFEIADRCSGLRMVVAAIAIALLYIYQARLRFGAAVLYLVAAVLLAIVVNIIRILTVVIAGHLTQMQHYFVTTDHVMLGWVLFGIGIFAFIFASNRVLLSDRWYRRVVRETAGNTKTTAGNNGSETSPVNGGRFNANAIMALVAATFAALAGPVMAMVYQPETDYKKFLNIELASAYDDWRKTESTTWNWQPDYHGADLHVSAGYVRGDGRQAPQTGLMRQSAPEPVLLHVYYYFHQAQGKEAIHYQNRLFDQNRWTVISRKNLETTIDPVGAVKREEIVLRSMTGNTRLLWRWYYVGGQRTLSAAKAKLLGIKGLLTGHPATTVFILATDIQDSPEHAKTRLRDFTAASLNELEVTVANAMRVTDKN